MENIVLAGSSGHAKVVIDIVERQGEYRIVGLLDVPAKIGSEVFGYRILGEESDLPILTTNIDINGVIVAIGDNARRADVSAKIAALSPALKFVTVIHPHASIGRGTSIGDGTVVMAGAVVNPCCVVGRSCIVNTRSSLDHDSVMGDFASLAPGVTVGGNCRIGSYAAIGIGAAVKHGVSIGDHSVVGGASMVMTDVPPFCVAYGSPARKMRERHPGERYL